MKLRYLILSSGLIFSGLFFSGCAASLTPIEVSDKFWTAARNQDASGVRKHVTSASLKSIEQTDPAGILPLDSVTLGKTVIDGEQAWVDTTVVISGKDPFSLPLKTVLLQENKQWKVDYNATMASISGNSPIARVLSRLNALGSEFADRLDQSMAEMQQTLPEVQKEIEKIEENMNQRLPELQRRMEEFVRQLEEILGGQKQPRAAPGTEQI